LLLPKNIVIYKDKWKVVYEDFKRIFYYIASMGNNTRYWDLTLQEKTNLNVFCHYNKTMYEMIDSFMGGHPMLYPSYVHNLMALDEHVFEVQFMQLKQNKTILFSSPNFISRK
jgi:hypothetical protein